MKESIRKPCNISYGNRDWNTGDHMILYGNGIDMDIVTQKPEIAYETACFRTIVETFPDLSVIGPHLTDFILSDDSTLASFGRPDSILLRRENSHMVVAGLAEFKTGSLHSHRKLILFSELLRALRRRPYLEIALDDAIGDVYETPRSITIPEDREIFVVFASPKKNGALFPGPDTPPFSLQHIFVPYKGNGKK